MKAFLIRIALYSTFIGVSACVVVDDHPGRRQGHHKDGGFEYGPHHGYNEHCPPGHRKKGHC